jgi:hypothetical protein
MAGAGYKLFVNGNALSASDLNTYVQQQTVMVFASASARTTALASVLAEGMVSYRTDSHVLEIYNGSAWISASPTTTKGDLATFDTASTRLPVGTDGQVLTAASGQTTGLQWATPSSGSMTLLSTTTLSGATTTISGISQSYTHLYCSWYGASCSGTAGWFINPNGSSSISNVTGVDSATAQFQYNGSMYLMINSPVAGAGLGNGGSFYIYNYSSTSVTEKGLSISSIYTKSPNTRQAAFLGGAIETSSGISSLVWSGATWTSGTVLVYGVK